MANEKPPRPRGQKHSLGEGSLDSLLGNSPPVSEEKPHSDATKTEASETPPDDSSAEHREVSSGRVKSVFEKSSTDEILNYVNEAAAQFEGTEESESSEMSSEEEDPLGKVGEFLSPEQGAAQVLKVLETTVWAFRIYDLHNEGFQIQLRLLEQSLKDFSKHFGSCVLKFTYKNVLLGGEEVWTWDGSDTSLFHRIYMDGIQNLEILPGIGRPELIKFLGILAADYNAYNYHGEDLGTMLWKAELEHIRQETLEGFEQIESFDLADQKEQEKLEAFVEDTMDTFQPTRLQSAGLIKDLLETRERQPAKMEEIRYPEHIPTVATPKGRLLFVEAEDLQAINEEIRLNRETNFVPPLFQALLEVFHVERRPEKVAILFQYLLFIADEYLDKGNWQELIRLAKTLNVLAKMEMNDGQSAQPLTQKILDQLAGAERIKAVEKILLHDVDVKTNLEELKLYLSQLPSRAVEPILHLAFRLPRGAFRRSVLDVLSEIGRGKEHLFYQFIEELSDEDLADLIYLLSHFQNEKMAPHLLQLARDCTGINREQSLVALLPIETTEVREHMIHTLYHSKFSNDDDEKCLRIAIQYCVRHNLSEAAKGIKTLVQQKEFEHRPFSERMRYFSILGEIGGVGVVGFFETLLKEEAGIFHKKNVEENKLCAVTGLAKIHHPRAEEILREVSGDQKTSAKLRNRCKVALAAMKEAAKTETKESGGYPSPK